MISVREIFENLMEEAASGVIVIDDVPYDVGFNTVFEEKTYGDDDYNPTLVISDRLLFFDSLAQYVDEELATREIDVEDEPTVIKKMIAELVLNMTPEELSDPVDALRTMTEHIREMRQDESYGYREDESRDYSSGGKHK